MAFMEVCCNHSTMYYLRCPIYLLCSIRSVRIEMNCHSENTRSCLWLIDLLMPNSAPIRPM